MATAKEVRSHPQWVQERRLRGWSQIKLAEVIGADRRSVNRWENGDGFPSPYFCERLCEVFGKNAEELELMRPDIRDSHRDSDINEYLRTREQSPSSLQDEPLSGIASSHHRINILVGMIVIIVIGTLSWRLIFQPGGKFSPSTSSTTATANVQQSSQEIYIRETSRKPAISDPLTGQGSTHWHAATATKATHGCSFSAGAYHVYASIPYVTECYMQTTMFRDFTLQVQMTVLKGDGGGLIFWTGGSSSQEYRFAVDPDTRYYDVFLPSEASRVVTGFSPSLILGQDQPNLLTLIAQGSVIYLYVNGHYMNQFQVPGRASVTEAIGIFATNGSSDSTEVAFRNLKVWT